MDIYWGIRNHSYNSDNVSKKRKLDLDGHKKKIYEVGEETMIYSVGTQVHFTAEINNETIEALIKEVTKVVNENLPKFGTKDEIITITYIVDSPGGSVTAVLKFVDFISMVKAKHPYVEFASIITGMAASAGTIMCVIADKRYMTKHAFAMIHELSTGNMGKYTQLISYSEFIKTMHNKLVEIYMKVFDDDKQKLEDLLKTESWFDADAYQKLGFVSELKG